MEVEGALRVRRGRRGPSCPRACSRGSLPHRQFALCLLHPPPHPAQRPPCAGTKKAPDCFRNQGLKVPATCYSPTGEPRSTLADEALHFRVRNGNGCCILSMATGKTIERFWLDAP